MFQKIYVRGVRKRALHELLPLVKGQKTIRLAYFVDIFSKIDQLDKVCHPALTWSQRSEMKYDHTMSVFVINMHGGDLEIVPHFKNRRRMFYSPGTMSGLPPTKKKRSTETENKHRT